MSTIIYKTDYQLLWDTCIIKTAWLNEVNSVVKKILANKKRYDNLNEIIKVPYPHSQIPWYFIAIVHKMEANLSFAHHLHNGDPLTKRTVQVPKGRPAKGNPPFSWEQSAFDALCNVAGLHNVEDWSIPAMLYKFESYNGFGYSKFHNMPSPYLFSGTNFYTKGKYTSDGKFDTEAVSKQLGVVPILKGII